MPDGVIISGRSWQAYPRDLKSFKVLGWPSCLGLVLNGETEILCVWDRGQGWARAGFRVPEPGKF